MRKFIIRTFAFVAMATAMMALLDIAITYQAQHSDLRPYWKWNHAIRSGNDADIYIMGNSRAWCHFSPAILDSAFDANTMNFGLDGAGFDWQLANYNLYRNNNPKPKLLIMTIDYSEFSITAGYERHQFFHLFLSPELRDSVFPVHHFSWAERYLPMYRYANYGLDKYFDKKPYTLYKGYAGQNRHWGEFDNTTSTNPRYAANGQIMEKMERHLAKASSEGINVVFVHAPTYSRYYPTIKNLDSMWTIVHQWSEKYDIPIIDYTSDPICDDTSCFYNPRHLNKKGAERISRQLANDIKELNLL